MSTKASGDKVPLVAGSAAEAETDEQPHRPLLPLSVAALGVVYGDIGTSPLYAFRQSVDPARGIPPSPAAVLGVLSLIVWSLIIVVSIKYLLFILRADNKGEGGIIALVALLNPWRSPPGSHRYFLLLLGLFGAALLYGDGTITPAISVLSAVEGLKIDNAAFDALIIPIAVAILVILFAVQKQGTARIGALFGPIMLLWFSVIGILGALSIARYPAVAVALNPLYALDFLTTSGMLGFIILGTVFLAVTGAETLYADMGHFGRAPIRLAWFVVALPALLLNYFGQGALVLSDPTMVSHPFYGLAPDWARFPIVILATAATVIASQAVISGTFSLTRQAVQLGQLPRMQIVQTDHERIGQIYIPLINWLLMAAAISLVIGFGSSSNLAAAYGLAVSADMVITTILALFVALRFGWNPYVAVLLALAFLVVDVAFLGSNLFKFADGGWYPVVLAGVVFGIMMVWRSGAARLGAITREGRESLDEFLQDLAKSPPLRVPGTAIFMTSSTTEAPLLLLHTIEHTGVLHERVVLVTVQVEDVPQVPSAGRVEIENLEHGFHRIVLHYGFVQKPNVPVGIRFCNQFGLDIDPDQATFFLGHEEIVIRQGQPLFSALRTRLFALLWRNATRATAFYNIPPKRVVAIALQVEM